MTLAVGRQSKISSDREGFFMHVGKQSDDRRLVLGVMFLTVSNLLTKICGMFLKVPLTNTLGDSGMAYFNLAYAVYKWFYMISTGAIDCRCHRLNLIEFVIPGTTRADY